MKKIFEKDEIESELEKTKKKRKGINLRWEEVTGQSQTLGPKLEPKLRKNDNLKRWDLGKKGVKEDLVVARSEKDAEKEGTKNGGENRDGVAKKRKIFEGNFKMMSEKERRLQKPLETKSETWKNWNGWGRDEGELIGR